MEYQLLCVGKLENKAQRSYSCERLSEHLHSLTCAFMDYEQGISEVRRLVFNWENVAVQDRSMVEFLLLTKKKNFIKVADETLHLLDDTLELTQEQVNQEYVKHLISFLEALLPQKKRLRNSGVIKSQIMDVGIMLKSVGLLPSEVEYYEALLSLLAQWYETETYPEEGFSRLLSW